MTPKVKIFFYAVALALIASGCGQAPTGEFASKPPATPAATSAGTAPPPAPVTAETRATYQWYCAQCHGIEGKGDGINAKLLAVPPRDHTKADYLETRSDEELFQTVRLGGLATGRAPCMPAWGNTLDEASIRSLVRYIRELCRCEAA